MTTDCITERRVDGIPHHLRAHMNLHLPLPPNSTEYNLFTCLKNRLNLGHCSLYLNCHLPRYNAFTMDTLNNRGHNLLSEYLSGNKEFLSQLVCLCVRERQR